MAPLIDVCYGESVAALYHRITSEKDHHVPQLSTARELWTGARTWIKAKADLLLGQANQLTGADHWSDPASRAFLQRVSRDVEAMLSWYDPSLMLSSAVSGSIPVPRTAATASQLPDRISELIGAITTTQAEVATIKENFDRLPEKEKSEKDNETRGQIVKKLDDLTPKYQAVTSALQAAVGWKWTGPQGGAPNPSGPSSSPGPAAAAPGTPASPGPAPENAQPSSPSPSAAEDPLKAAIAEAPNALDAASQALQGLQQLMGGSSPSPTSLSDLGSLTPAEVADRLGSLGSASDSGLPSLAGGGGGGPTGGGFPATVPMASPATDPGTTAATVPAFGTTAATSTTAAASSPGMIPPMQPRGAGGGKAREIKPGDAEHPATGKPRARKPGATPGVALPGRAGRRGAKAEPAPRRRWDTENDTVQLLDEELWQVDKNDGAPRYRAGH